MWLIGQYLSSTFDNGCTPDKAAAMYETLEVVCYEIIGSQKAASSEETHICSAKFINVLMSTLAKVWFSAVTPVQAATFKENSNI